MAAKITFGKLLLQNNDFTVKCIYKMLKKNCSLSGECKRTCNVG